MESVGARIKRLRTNADMTQSELAARLGKSESAVRMWELDKSEPRIEALRQLAVIFNVSVDWIIGVPER